MKGIFTRLRDGLAKTRKALTEQVDRLVVGKKEIDDEALERLEEILIMGDVGVKATNKLIQQLSQMVSKKEINDSEQLKHHLKDEVLKFLDVDAPPLDVCKAKPFVIMVVGVNGTGKTTAIAKMAKWFKDQGRQSILAAADTFRAAAIEQLEIWGRRANVDIIKRKAGADPSAVVFDAVNAAKERDVDIVIIDTAGRLHTKINLMEELKKIKRVVDRIMPGAPHEVLLVLDATTGQNAIAQTKMFHEALGVTGLILTKLDGTAKGGIVIGICHEFNIPIRFIGVGEKIGDLSLFDAKEFTQVLL